MKILAIDGNSILNRAFYGVRLLSTKDGTYTNAVYGFLTILNKLRETENPDGIVIGWDLHAPTFRHKMYADYKAGRKPMPEELRGQFPLIKEILTFLGCKNIEIEGYEADDILGTISKICEDGGAKCAIATGDRDSLQLVSDSTEVLLATTSMGRPQVIHASPNYILEKYGTTPAGMIEIKALQGDQSDNIPGVAGVGEKTAQSLITNYKTIQYIYDNIDSLDIKDSVKKKLLADKDKAFLSRTLGEICRTVPIETNVNAYFLSEQNNSALYNALAKLEMFKLIKQMGITQEEAKKETQTVDYNAVDFSELHLENECTILFFEDFATVTAKSSVAKIEKEKAIKILEDENIIKTVHDAKYCYRLSENAKQIEFDTSLAAYLINPSMSSYSIDDLAGEYALTSALDEPFRTAALHSELKKELSQKLKETEQEKLFKEIEMPLSKVLAKMETVGFMVDTAALLNYGKELSERIDELLKEIYSEVGYEFNVNSPKQLGVALFEKLGLPAKKKTKSGYSTSAEVLEELKFSHPAVEKVLEYRTLAKLKSTYCDALAEKADENGRIHSTLNQTETRTGRISSSEPNLQNIPVRKPEGSVLRKFFRAKDGFTLVDADYSQIELRVLAAMADDKNMISAFKSGEDIHTATAAEVFKMPPLLITPQLRSRAKAVNFGIVYGIGAFSLAKDIGVSRKEADEYIKAYLETYSGVADFMEKSIESAREKGYAETLYGRRRPLPELRATNHMLRSFGERVARNAPIQGTAADIIKLAMIKADLRFEKELPEAHLIMQVHDELIAEVPKGSEEKALKILKEEMENAVKLSVPLTADAAVGDTWYDAKG